MRVLRLDLGAEAVELHPFVTVVRGLAPQARARLLDVLAGLPAGRAPVTGVVEAHGVLLDLAPATLDLLDLRSDLDVIVRSEDVPHHGVDAPPEVAAARRQATDADARLRAAEAAVVDAVARRDAAREALELASAAPASTTEPAGPAPATGAAAAGAEGELTRLRAEHAAAVKDLQAAEHAAEAARANRAEAARATSVSVAALEAASERRDPTAAAVVDAARRRLAEAEAHLDAVRAGRTGEAGESGEATAADSAETMRIDRVALEAALLALDTTDPLPVKVALTQLEDGAGEGMVASPEALELAERWAILEIDLDRAGIAGDEDPADRVEDRSQATARLEAAEAAVAEIEAILRGPVLDPGDVAELERAHDAVAAARDAAEKRFGAAKAAKRLDEALAQEQAVLDRLGFVTWADYRLGAPAAAVASEDELAERLVTARLELERAQAEYREREATIDAELARAEVLDRRRKLRSAAIAVLGADPGNDVEGALRRHRVSAASTGEHLQRLRQALEGAGMVLADEDVDERLLSDLARVWLKEQQETEEHRRSLEVRIAELDVRLAELEAAERSPVSGEPLAAAAGALEDARAALAAAEARQRRDLDASEEVDRLRAGFEAASAAEGEAAGAVAAADERVLAASQRVSDLQQQLRGAERQLAAAADAERAAVEAAAERDRRVAEARHEGLGRLHAELDEASLAVEEAKATLADRGREVGDARAALAAAEQRAAAAPSAPSGADDHAGGGDDVEWYLLARLAAQRSVSYAGSVPLVLDDALDGFDPDTTRSILGRLERMATTVQLVLVTEDLSTAAWAESLGRERAYVAEL